MKILCYLLNLVLTGKGQSMLPDKLQHFSLLTNKDWLLTSQCISENYGSSPPSPQPVTLRPTLPPLLFYHSKDLSSTEGGKRRFIVVHTPSGSQHLSYILIHMPGTLGKVTPGEEKRPIFGTFAIKSVPLTSYRLYQSASCC